MRISYGLLGVFLGFLSFLLLDHTPSFFISRKVVVVEKPPEKFTETIITIFSSWAEPHPRPHVIRDMGSIDAESNATLLTVLSRYFTILGDSQVDGEVLLYPGVEGQRARAYVKVKGEDTYHMYTLPTLKCCQDIDPCRVVQR